MENNPAIAFIDFDKTLYDLQIPDFEQKRNELIQEVEARFQVRDNFYPILENTIQLSKDNKALKKYVFDFIDTIEHQAPGYFYDYAGALLKNVAAKMPVVIVSNNSSEVIAKRLTESHLRGYVKYIYGRDTYDFVKPMGEVLFYCCDQVKINPLTIGSFLYIGDSWRDYKCASDFASKNNINYTFLHANSLTGKEII